MMRWEEERIQEQRSGAPVQYVLRQDHQGFSKHHWPSLEGMRAIKQRPYKRCTWQILSQGGQRQSCVDELTRPMLLNVFQLSEAILPSVSFNSNGPKRLAFKVSACYKEEGKYPHLMDKGMWITSGKMWHGVFTMPVAKGQAIKTIAKC